MDYILKQRSDTYRQTIPQLNADLLIIACVHQGSYMLDYMIRNIDKYVDGSKILVIHVNFHEDIDETTLPPWVWLVRNTIETERFIRSFAHAATECLDFAIKHFTFKNVLTFSSGCAFVRKFPTPKNPVVHCMDSEYLINPGKDYVHIGAIPFSLAGQVGKYLIQNKHNYWCYPEVDKDTDFHDLMRKRNYQYFKGATWLGMIFPYELAVQFRDDMLTMRNKPNGKWQCEEVYFSTYAYNYALQNNLELKLQISMLNRDFYYEIEDMKYVDLILNHSKFNDIYILCKFSENVNDPVRFAINL
jgi:hypothetical protein